MVNKEFKHQITEEPQSKRPVIIEQTSIKTTDSSGDNRISDFSPRYKKLSEELSHRWEDIEEDQDILSNMYNEYYGKISQNLPDVVQGMVGNKIVSFFQKEGFITRKSVDKVKHEEDMEKYREVIKRVAHTSWNPEMDLRKREARSAI